MKIIINKILVVALIIAFFPAISDAKNKIRVVNVDIDKYQDEYISAMESDPWRGFNTAMFEFNDALDQYMLEPLARAYRYAFPEWGRDRVSDFFNNLEETTNFANSILQGDVEGSFRSMWRFIINSSFGIGGLHDVASGFGLHEKDKFFSQTLAVYGVGSGPYLVAPLFGPSSARDFFGNLVDRGSNPTTYVDGSAGLAGVGVLETVNSRERILDFTDSMKRNSFDIYSSQKSGYLQNRKKKLLESLE